MVVGYLTDIDCFEIMQIILSCGYSADQSVVSVFDYLCK